MILRYLRQELSATIIFTSFLTGILFLLFVDLIPNMGFLFRALTSSEYAFLSMLWAFLSGVPATVPTINAWLLFVVGFLTALNVSLVLKRGARLRSMGATGSSSFLGVLAGGCSACATGILPLIGLGGVVAILPFHGIELAVVAIVLLCVTLYWNARAGVCAAD